MSSSFIKTLLLFVLCVPLLAHGQAFHFLQTSTTIKKSTAQSPAHWYLEIFNDVSVDTSLRWKADLSAIPPGWTITFDDGSNFYSGVQSGDSADFVLQDSLALPQKLIIGAFTNNIPAIASAFFDIYNPADTAPPTTIEYLFKISQAVGINPLLDTLPALYVANDKIYFSFSRPLSVSVFTLTGQSVFTGYVAHGELPVHHLEKGCYLVLISDGLAVYSRKIFL